MISSAASAGFHRWRCELVFGKEQAEGRFGGHFDLFDAGGFHLAPRALDVGFPAFTSTLPSLSTMSAGGFLAVQLGIEVPGDAARPSSSS